MQYLLLSHDNNRNANARQCYVTRCLRHSVLYACTAARLTEIACSVSGQDAAAVSARSVIARSVVCALCALQFPLYLTQRWLSCSNWPWADNLSALSHGRFAIVKSLSSSANRDGCDVLFACLYRYCVRSEREVSELNTVFTVRPKQQVLAASKWRHWRLFSVDYWACFRDKWMKTLALVLSGLLSRF